MFQISGVPSRSVAISRAPTSDCAVMPLEADRREQLGRPAIPETITPERSLQCGSYSAHHPWALQALWQFEQSVRIAYRQDKVQDLQPRPMDICAP